MSRILDYILEPNVVYTNGAFLIKVKVEDSYKYKKLLVTDNMKYSTLKGSTLFLFNATNQNNASCLDIEGNTSQSGTPTPDNPVDINTVSKDNKIVVSGKNIFDSSKIYAENKFLNTTGTLGDNSNYNTYKVNIGNSGTYTISMTRTETANRSLRINAYKINGTFISNLLQTYWNSETTISQTFTIPNNTGFILISSGKLFDTAQIEKGSAATTYEPYQGSNYRVDLGGKNLFIYPYTYTTTTTNGITFTDNGDGSITINGTATAIAIFYIKTNTWAYDSNYILPKGTYTINGLTSTPNVYLGLNLYDTDNTSTFIRTQVLNSQTFTISTTQSISNPRIVVNSGQTVNNITVYPQLELGSIATDYSPYTDNPIELCKIGNYVDSIKKSTGINLAELDSTQDITKYTYTSFKESDITVNKTATGGSFYASFTIHIPKAGTYIISGNNISNNQMYIYTDSLWGTLKESFTPTRDSNGNFARETSFTTAGNYIIGLYGSATGTYSTKNFMCTETTPTTFEPYGTNWYIEKNIGKVVLNGSETWSIYSSGTANWYYYADIPSIDIIGDTTETNSLCDHYVFGLVGNSNTNTGYYIVKNQKRVRIRYGSEDTIANYQTWLSSNNVKVYYIMTNPTYEVITNDYLIEQLEAAQDMYLVNNLCYVDWIGTIPAVFTLQYPTTETINDNIVTEDNKLIRTEWGS